MCGEDVAETWFWCHTPMPIGLPLDEQLDFGLTLASVGRDAAIPLMREDRDRYEREVSEAMRSYQEELTS
jgi:hypothetical protein